MFQGTVAELSPNYTRPDYRLYVDSMTGICEPDSDQILTRQKLYGTIWKLYETCMETNCDLTLTCAQTNRNQTEPHTRTDARLYGCIREVTRHISKLSKVCRKTIPLYSKVILT